MFGPLDLIHVVFSNRRGERDREGLQDPSLDLPNASVHSDLFHVEQWHSFW